MAESVYAIHAFYSENDLEVDSYLSRPLDSKMRPGIVLLHEWWGLDNHHREITRKLAREGYVVLTPHLYGRETKPTTDREEAARRKVSLNLEQTVREIELGADYLRKLPYVSENLGIVGFCMGGGLALLALCETDDFQAGVSYYPSIYPSQDSLQGLTAPVLFHSGAEDFPTHRSELKRIKQGLSEIREEMDRNENGYEYYEYEDAGHAFMNPEYSYYNERAASQSWERTVAFLNDQLK